MSRVGSDIRFMGGTTMWGSGTEILETLHAQGLDGVNIRAMYDLSPTLDRGELDDFRQAALDLGMYVEMGIGKINPYMTAELPAVRALGNGDYLAGMVRMIETAADMGWSTLWTACAGVKDYPAPFNTDRYRAEAPWEDQLRATSRLVSMLLPALRQVGATLAIETHEEITTFELVRLLEELDDPAIGVCLDPGNLAARGEVPDEGIRRVAPYVVSTQLRDVVLFPSEQGVVRYLSPVGHGLLDWTEVLALLLEHRPALNLTIEAMGGSRGRMEVPFEDPFWLSVQPDFTDADRAGLRALAEQHVRRVRAGESEPTEVLDRIDPDHRSAHDRFVAESARHLREVLARLRSGADDSKGEAS